MYNIDGFIARLQELRAIAPGGGKTPVVIESGEIEGMFEPAAAELQPAIEVLEESQWVARDNGNDIQVLRVF